MTKELIERITQAREHTQLYGQVLPALWVYQPFTMNAGELFSAIEALQARVVELGDELERERICHAACGVIALSNTPESAATMRQMKDEYRSASVQDACNAVDREMALRVERDSLAAELAAARAQEPVSHRYRFTHPISGEPVWRDSSPTWNGQCVQEVQPLFAAPVPPVREPLSDNAIAALRQAIAQPATTEWTVIAPDGTRFTGPTPLKAALPASKYRLEIDPVAAVKFMEIIDQEAEKGRQEAEQCMRDYGTLDCPACGGSGHIGDVKQPAQVPAWQPIESGFPATGIPVLADIGEKYPIRACWIAKFTQEIGASDFEGDNDYDEATDTAYWPEGWYEWNRFDETHWLVDKPVKNWALLPAAPEVK